MDTLSIAVPKRIANCWLGFGLSSWTKDNRNGTLALLYYCTWLQVFCPYFVCLNILLRTSFYFNEWMIDWMNEWLNQSINHLPGFDCCFGLLCWQFGAGCFLTVDFWHCWGPPGPPEAQAEARSRHLAQTSAILKGLLLEINKTVNASCLSLKLSLHIEDGCCGGECPCLYISKTEWCILNSTPKCKNTGRSPSAKTKSLLFHNFATS